MASTATQHPSEITIQNMMEPAVPTMEPPLEGSVQGTAEPVASTSADNNNVASIAMEHPLEGSIQGTAEPVASNVTRGSADTINVASTVTQLPLEASLQETGHQALDDPINRSRASGRRPRSTTTTCTMKLKGGAICGKALPAEEIGKYRRCQICRRKATHVKRLSVHNISKGRGKKRHRIAMIEESLRVSDMENNQSDSSSEGSAESGSPGKRARDLWIGYSKA
ncbi:hypothetical protein FIBSPDRAFT_895728 [Athelia psychrophila]|uniref:Uncharacterized protein n=1 Tax=Athelia psychrophila TaxID=1759441 RepID=A0A166EAN4_9AGAM|nr:hypothetical protein FIBSPDRAFT_895728 [Fibularhizoctonia sp. CBS 109695]